MQMYAVGAKWSMPRLIESSPRLSLESYLLTGVTYLFAKDGLRSRIQSKKELQG